MTSTTSETHYIDRPGGRIAYDVQGTGPLVLLVPGMGDLRATWRFVQPALAAAGFRVVAMDLRGHGDSDTTFDAFDDEATASDVLALVDHLGGPAVVVGNSMGAGAAVIAAAQRPEAVRALVLVGPFVRNPHANVIVRGMMRLALATPWIATTWKAYLPKLYAGQRPVDDVEYRAAVDASIRRPGRAKAVNATTKTTHAPAEAALADVHAPALVLMGALDPDFPDPEAEARWIGAQLGGQVVMVPDAGHYPQSQQPVVVADAMQSFLQALADA